ncbi:protoporphyrinogen oxidase [Viridibacillus sp. FSL R5-0477]|uniref:Coproporphyrinogen III oxidase n=1 Tax=Viridibacillus arenosi FSL R5-213 TaxID=1227360 RepID=W4ENA1_9BACL|nr:MULTISPECIES: protoporphyrinogen oxidase [Viridibacillus]ETT82058.1 protoporphyrinogen oxidase [Viridibacillus arenosi FSL R5-213]OMC81370.1 protoporphyrinogen oxidase [Viridibacillus sp. FSL H8-0123]OMC90413.1 protoporphyrinogen oxidase [Viridibacillus arenosi]
MIDVTEQKQRVAVIGGGISGLAAAFYLQQEAKEKKLPLEIVLIESSHRLGGKIQTVRKENFIIERGPNSFIDNNNSMAKLVKDLGIEDQLIRSEAGQTYITVNEKLYPVPAGSILGIPTKLSSFLASDIVSWSGKVRATCDLWFPRSRVQEDQPLGKFIRRRFGKETVENIIEPLLLGISAGDIEQLSLQATFPELIEMEKEYRSLMTGMKKALSETSHDDSKSIEERSFQTFINGLETLIEALEGRLIDTTILKSVKVESIAKAAHQVTLSLNNKTSIAADAVILATPHLITQKMFAKQGLLQNLQDIPLATVATVSMAFPIEAMDESFNGSGFTVARNSDFSITSCSWIHRKWPAFVPEGYALLEVYVGRSGDEAIVDLSDGEIEKIVLQDLNRVTPLKGSPLFTVVSRWKEAMPQYTVGHTQRVELVKQELYEHFPTMKLVGSSYEGTSLPNCVDQARSAVDELLIKLFE